MNHSNVFWGLLFSFGLSACASHKVDPTLIQATASYFPQAVEVTTSEDFMTDLEKQRGGTPQQLAAAFTEDVQTGLSKDLPRVMKGQRPALIKIQFIDINTGLATFQSPTSTVVGNVSIVDVASGVVVAETTVTADDSAQATETNRNPLGALGGTLILKAIVDRPNLMLWHLARIFRSEVKTSLGNKSIF